MLAVDCVAVEDDDDEAVAEAVADNTVDGISLAFEDDLLRKRRMVRMPFIYFQSNFIFSRVLRDPAPQIVQPLVGLLISYIFVFAAFDLTGSAPMN